MTAQLADLAILGVIAEPTRRRILDAVRATECSVNDLVDLVGMHQPGVSRHLKVLRDAGLVEVRQDAQRRMYRLRAEPLQELDAWLEPYRAHWSGRLDALERHLERTSTPIDRTKPNPSPRAEGAPMTDTTSPRYDGTVEQTADGGVIRFERHLPYPVRDVWDAITEPARLAEWWLPFDADITVDLREGGLMVMSAVGDEPVEIICTILRVEPPMLLEHTHADPGSFMRWELEAVDTGCVLRLTHFVPDPDPAAAVDKCFVVGLHTSLSRLEPCLAGRPVAWDWDEFAESQGRYAAIGLAPPPDSD